jgi:hypothetical protein
VNGSDDENLQLTISGSDEGASATVNAAADAVAQFIARLEAALEAGTNMGRGVAAGADTAKSALGQLAGVTGAVDAGLSSIGVTATGVTGAIGGLNEMLVGLGKAAGPLLLLAAAAEAVGAGFNFLKDSVAIAADFEMQMRRIQTALGEQGSTWDSTREKIEQFVESEARFTGTSAHDILDAFDKITVAGHDYHDAVQMITVAEDVHTATGASVAEVTEKIIAAEAGRTRGLIALDPRLKDVIKSHGSMDQILTKLAEDMAGQATNAADQYTVSVGKLGAAWDDFKKDVGEWLIPWLNNLVLGIDAVVESMHNLWKQLAGSGGVHTGNPVMDAITDTFVQMAAQHAAAAGRHDDVKKHGVNLDYNPTPTEGTSGSGGSGGSVSTQPIEDAAPQTDAYTESEKALNDQLDLSNNKIDLLKAHISDATTAAQKQRLENEAHVAILKILNDEFERVGEALAQESVDQTTLQNKVDSTTAAYERARAAFNAADNARVAAGDGSIATANKIAVLRDNVTQATKAMDDANKALKENTDNLDANKKKLAEINLKRIEEADALNKVKEAYDEFTHKEATALEESVRTVGMTTAQKIAYYEQLRAAMGAVNADNLKDIEEVDKKIQDAELESLKERQEKYQDFIKTIQGFEETFFDDVIQKHKSIADSFRDMLKDMLSDYEKWFEQMLAQNTLGAFNKSIANMFFGGSTSGMPGVGGGATTSANGSETNPFYVNLTPNAMAALTGSNTGIASTASTGAFGLPVTIAGIGGGNGGSSVTPVSPTTADNGWSSSSVSLNAAMGANNVSLGGILQGAGLGAMIGGVDGGSQLWASVGGGLGDAAGTVLGGPVGGQIGSVLGSLVGSMFGPHWGAATNYPDRSDTSNYGQFLANWQGGTPSVNGQKFTAAPGDNSAMGGTPIWQQMQQWATGLGGNTSGLTADEQAMYKQIEGLLGGNPNGNLGVANEKNGVLTLGDGSTISVTAAEQLVNSFTNQASGTSTSPVFTVTHSYPNANQTTSTQTGTYTETGNGQSYLGTVAGAAAPGSAGTVTVGNTPRDAGVTVNLTVQGSLVGAVPNDIVNQIAKAVMNARNGVGSGNGNSPFVRPIN